MKIYLHPESAKRNDTQKKFVRELELNRRGENAFMGKRNAPGSLVGCCCLGFILVASRGGRATHSLPTAVCVKGLALPKATAKAQQTLHVSILLSPGLPASLALKMSAKPPTPHHLENILLHLALWDEQFMFPGSLLQARSEIQVLWEGPLRPPLSTNLQPL